MKRFNKHELSEWLLHKLYVDELKSISEVSREISVPLSTVRFWLIEFGLLRTKADAIRLAAKQGKVGNKLRGRTRIFTPEWKENIGIARRRLASENARGITKKPNGYIEHTTGENKGRSVHRSLMESAIGRRLANDEVVHHIDHNRSNNVIENLQLMKRSEHASLHAIENNRHRERNMYGQFK